MEALIVLLVIALLGLAARRAFRNAEPDLRTKNEEFKRRQAEGRVRDDTWKGKGDRL